MHWRCNSGAARRNGRLVRFGQIGMSDILGVLPDGRILAIEVKAAKGITTTAQEIFLSHVRARGGCAFVARSVEDVVRGLCSNGKGEV